MVETGISPRSGRRDGGADAGPIRCGFLPGGMAPIVASPPRSKAENLKADKFQRHQGRA